MLKEEVTQTDWTGVSLAELGRGPATNSSVDSFTQNNNNSTTHTPEYFVQRDNYAAADTDTPLISTEVNWYNYPLHSFSILAFKTLCSLTFFLDIKDSKVVLDNDSSLATLCRLLGCSISDDLVKWFKTHVTYMAWVESHDIWPQESYSTVRVSGEIAVLKFGRM
jgi:hypothetical protein